MPRPRDTRFGKLQLLLKGEDLPVPQVAVRADTEPQSPSVNLVERGTTGAPYLEGLTLLDDIDLPFCGIL